jgi:hypothetical protein
MYYKITLNCWVIEIFERIIEWANSYIKLIYRQTDFFLYKMIDCSCLPFYCYSVKSAFFFIHCRQIGSALERILLRFFFKKIVTSS